MEFLSKPLVKNFFESYQLTYEELVEILEQRDYLSWFEMSLFLEMKEITYKDIEITENPKIGTKIKIINIDKLKIITDFLDKIKFQYDIYEQEIILNRKKNSDFFRLQE